MFNEHNMLVPPFDTVFNVSAGNWATIIFSLLSIATFLVGVRHWRKTNDPIVLLMMLGGLTTVIVEPYLDFIGGAFHPIPGQDTAFDLMGRPIPLWVVPCYIFLFGGLGTLNFMGFSKGATMRTVWLWFFVPMVIDIVMEEIMLSTNLYYYYGQQPLIAFIKFPLWWSAANGMGVYLGVVLVTLMAPYLRGWKLLLIPLVMPLADVIGYATVALPPIMAVHTPNVSPLVSNLAGIACLGLTALTVHAVALVLGTDSPLRKGNPDASPIQSLVGKTATA